MNILIFSWRGPKHPHAGGAEIVTHEHAKAWVKAGHTVTLFTSSAYGLKEQEEIDGVKIIRRGNQLITVQIYAFFWYLTQNERFDIVLDHFHGIPFFTPLFVQTKKVAFIHEVAREVWKMNALNPSIAWIPAFFGPIIEPLIFKFFYKNIPFITVSKSTKEDLKKIGIPEKKVTIIHNGLTLPKKVIKYSKEKKGTVMYLGAIAKDKGIDDAIEVFGKLKKKKNDWQFWVVGKGDEIEVKRLKERAKELGIEKDITFWGFVDENKKFELLSRAHILINPSYHEGWGLVNLEANAMGTPVVGYNVHGIRDSVIDGKNGYLAEKGNYTKMSEHVIKIIDNKALYKKMQINVIAWSNQFTWQKSTQRSLHYLQDLEKQEKNER